MSRQNKRSRRRRVLQCALALGGLLLLAGCHTVGYYAQALRGHCQIIAREKSCAHLLADTNTPLELRVRLELAARLCDFAQRSLKLAVNGNYRDYADLKRPYVVWNVYAAPRFSLEPKTWWYPFVGSLDYQGYFSEGGASDCAARLRRRGYDAAVEGVEAYSTLGWFKDPLLNTWLHHEESAVAETLFHELAHQRVFAAGDTDFNEAFATTAGQEGARRWLRAGGDPNALQRYEAALARNAQFVALVQRTRSELENIYGDQRTADGELVAVKSPPSPPDQLLAEKQLALDGLKRAYEQLKASWGGHAGYDAWFATGPNNAQLNSVATYYDLVPAFERLLAVDGDDLEKFYATAGQLARLPKTERHRRLTMPLN